MICGSNLSDFGVLGLDFDDLMKMEKREDEEHSSGERVKCRK